MRLEESMKAGTIELPEIACAEIAPGRFMHMLKERAGRDGVKIAVIDGLNGCFEVMPDTKLLKLQLHLQLAFGTYD